MNSAAQKKLILSAALVAAAMVVLVMMKTSTVSQPASPVPETGDQTLPTRPSATPKPAVHPQREVAVRNAAPDPDPDANPMLLSREKIEEYLALHHRDAASLLTAFHASMDPSKDKPDLSYLREAATNYPHDPHVQVAVLAHNAFPDDRRQWLDDFKASSPSNSLANYLSAREYFDQHNPNAALKELTEATSKRQFAEYSMESFLGMEDLFRSLGEPPRITATAAMSAMAADNLPQLAGFKGIANGMADVQKQFAGAGDPTSVENLSQMGVVLANRLEQGDGGRFYINQLVGFAVENIVLQSLDQNTPYDFLGGQTPAQRVAAIKAQKQAFKESVANSTPLMPFMSDAEMVNYIERVKVYGEVPAMQWLRQQHPVTPGPGN